MFVGGCVCFLFAILRMIYDDNVCVCVPCWSLVRVYFTFHPLRFEAVKLFDDCRSIFLSFLSLSLYLALVSLAILLSVSSKAWLCVCVFFCLLHNYKIFSEGHSLSGDDARSFWKD